MDVEIECGFNVNDETINFGSRALALHESYESATLASMKISEYFKGIPCINAKFNGGKLFYSIDHTFGSFKDKQYTAVEFSCTFETVIDIIYISPDQSLALIFLRNGSLQILQIANGEYNLINKIDLIVEEEIRFAKLFIDCHTERFQEEGDLKEFSFIVVVNNGQIFRLKMREDVDSGVSVTQELYVDLKSKIQVSAFCNSLLFLNGRRMWVIDLLDGTTISTSNLDMKYAQFADMTVLALLASGKLFQICPYTLKYNQMETDLSFQTICALVDDRTVLSYYAAVTEKEENGEDHLKLLNPDFSPVYSLKVSSEVVIIKPENDREELQYISLVKKGESLEELRFQYIYETDPEKRLFRLFRRKMFDEAELFAKTHNIDISIVNKEKAKMIVEKLNCSTKDIDDLLDIFKTLDDEKFVLESCLTVESACCSSDDIQRILEYGCNLEIDKKNKEAKEVRCICFELYSRFKLFVLLGYNIEEWTHFSSCSLLHHLKTLLKNNKVSEAIIVFSKLNVKDLEDQGDDQIEEIIDMLNYLDLDDVLPFLSTFIPLTLKGLPSTYGFFVKWFEMKVYQLESAYKESFPQNAIDFLKTTSEFLNVDSILHRSQDLEDGVIFENLQRLSKNLTNLQVLKSSYGLRIPLKEFMQGPQAVVNILLNSDLALDVYNRMLQKFCFKFILENNLNPDEIYWNELENILRYQESFWIKIVSSILNCIKQMELKFRAVEMILHKAQLPWSNTVREIGKKMLDITHPMTSVIRNLIEAEPAMIVLNKKEYRIQKFRCTTIDDLEFLVKRIIFCNLPAMITDIFQLCGGNELFQIEARRQLFHHFLEIGDFQSAFQMLQDKKSVTKKCIEIILTDIYCFNGYLDTDQMKNYFQCLDMIAEIYVSSTDEEVDKYDVKKKIDSLKRIHNLENHFNVRVGNDLSQKDTKKRFETELLTKLVNDYEDNHNISDLLVSCGHLAADCELVEEEILLQCCLKVDAHKHELLCSVAKEFLKKSDKVDYLSILTVYILQNLDAKSGQQILENSFIDYNTSRIAINENSGDMLEMAIALITKAVVRADSEELLLCLKIVPWIDSIYFLKRYKTEKSQDSCIFEDCFDIKDLNPSKGSLLAIQKIFTMFTSFIAQFKNREYQFLTYFNKSLEPVSQEDFLSEIKDFERLFHILNQDGESLLSYKLVTTLLNEIMIHKDLEEIQKKLTSIIKLYSVQNLFQSSITKNVIDENLLNISLMWCNSKGTEKFIERAFQCYRKSPKNLTTIARVGEKIFQHHNNVGPKNFCTQVLLKVKWWEKVKHLIIDYNSFFKMNSIQRLELLINTDDFDSKRIKEYCSDFSLHDVQSFYLSYLKSILLNWKPKYDIVVHNTGERNLVMKENQEKQLYEKCIEVLKCLEEREKVNEMLQDVWSQVNFYHYEVFACILEISEGYKHLKSMLLFLKEYKRINAPSDTETERWFSSFPECQSIDPLSEFRLLFNSTILDSKEIWNIIRKEISLKNYNIWFVAVQAFSCLTVDDICSFLVKELIAQGVLNTIEPGEWLYPQQKNLFLEIDKCLQNMNIVEMKKTTAAYCLLSNTPEGADQVIIATITYKYAQEYKNMEPDSSNTISFAKIEKKYQRCLSLQILHKYNLAEESYIDSILNIEQLCSAIYQDERIIKRAEYIKLHCQDINKAAKEISDIFEFDIKGFRRNLVKDFLIDAEIVDVNRDMSIGFGGGITPLQKESSSRSEDNLKRAAYVCSSDLEFWQNFLLKESNAPMDLNNPNFFYRSRCLKCLLMIADPAKIEILTLQSFQTFMSRIDELTLSSIVSNFGMHVDVGDAKSWKTIMKTLAHVGNPDSVRALAEICKILKITNVKYWEYIIRSANHFAMFADLKEYLELTKNESYKFENFYINAWQRLIDHNMTLAFNLNHQEIEESLIECLFLIQTCPVFFSLDLERSYKQCIQNNRYGAALFVTQFIPKKKSEEYFKDIRNMDNYDEVVNELDKLESYGVATKKVKQLLKSL